MADSAARSFQRLGFEQRLAGVGALLLLVSTFGPFSFVEGAEVLVALAVLVLLRARAHGKGFHLPFGDGAVMFAGGAWAGVLILIRLFDRPLGQNLLALLCAAILLFAGLREHVRAEPGEPGRRQGDPPWPGAGEPPDDLMRRPEPGEAPDRARTRRMPADPPSRGAADPAPDRALTEQLSLGDPPDTARTEPLAPPEFEPGAEPAPRDGGSAARGGEPDGEPHEGEAGGAA